MHSVANSMSIRVKLNDIYNASASVIDHSMAGWKCKVCAAATWRRPPGNICTGCKSSRRGRHNVPPRVRFKGKASITAQGKAELQQVVVATPKRVRVEKTGSEPKEEMKKACPGSAKGSDSRSGCAQDEDNSSPRVKLLNYLESTVLVELKHLFGPAVAYTVVATAMTILDKFQTHKAPLPAESHSCCARSLVSFSFACSGIPDEDLKRKAYLAFLTQQQLLSVNDMRNRECWWAMLSPFCAKSQLP